MQKWKKRVWRALLPIVAVILVLHSCEHEPISQTNHNDDPGNNPDTGICFERDIQPIFKTYCATQGCHDANTQEEEYILDTYDNITKRGIVKFSASASKIYEVIRQNEMPRYPVSPLSDAQKDLIKRWINEGAKDGTDCPTKCDTTSFTYSGAIGPLMQTKCTGCHSTSNMQGNIDLSNYDGVKSAAVSGKLMNSLNRTVDWMPKGGNKLADCEMVQIKKWIDAGTPNN